MRPKTAVTLAVLITFAIRMVLVLSAGDIALSGYEAVLHIDHITETGLPMTENPLGWGGASTATMSLFYYLLAFLGMFLPDSIVLLVVPNLLISLIPIPVYLLATQISKEKSSIAVITLASVFIPLLYQRTLLTVSPLSLAIPLLFLACYYFIRIQRTPRDQKAFVITTVALVLTHPISLILSMTMAVTLLLLHVQRLGIPRAMTEATLFAAFLSIWANSIVYKNALQHYGLKTFWIGGQLEPSFAIIPTLVGAVTLVLGVYGAYRILTSERNVPGHALVSLAIVSGSAVLLSLLTTGTALIVLSISLLLLAAHGIDVLLDAKRRSRIPAVHSAFLVFLLGALLVTSAIPAIALGIESFQSIPGNEEKDVLDSIAHTRGRTAYWDTDHGYYLEAHGYSSAVDSKITSRPDAPSILADLSTLSGLQAEIQIVELLNQHDITLLILQSGHGLLIGERCFETLHDDFYEVYAVRCVVQ